MKRHKEREGLLQSRTRDIKGRSLTAQNIFESYIRDARVKIYQTSSAYFLRRKLFRCITGT